MAAWLLMVIAATVFAFSRPRFDGADILLMLLVFVGAFMFFNQDTS